MNAVAPFMGCVDVLVSATLGRRQGTHRPFPPPPPLLSCINGTSFVFSAAINLILSAIKFMSPHLAGASGEGDSPKTPTGSPALLSC